MQEWLFADHLKMASFVVAVLDGPDRHPYPGTALTIRVEMASFVVAVLDGPDRHPYPGTALTIRVEEWLFADHLKMASFVVAVLDGPDRHPYPGTALTIRVEASFSQPSSKVPEYVRVFGYTTFQAMLERGTRSPQPGAHPPAPEGRQPHCRREGRQQDASSPGC
ncbi:UNVERIFIED_CONTAM: hypothetical protein K2H54_004994 [Gekko kuhli]